MPTFEPPRLSFPGTLDPAGFLAGYWQKRPLVMRDAFPGWVNPLEADELAWLAGQDDVEARIVMTRGDRYDVSHGPFDAARFDAMGQADWTLLVQDVDKHLPDLAVVLDRFDFVPAWRLDDLMISFAAPGGSVGPHVDNYDVFLLQAEGRRTWHVGEHGAARADRSGGELALVDAFEPVLVESLGPGDMLYLPPGVPHHGIADEATLTWSIGFRAPSVADMVASFSGVVADSAPDNRRYCDPDLTIDEAAGGMLSDRAVARARAVLEAALAADTDTVRHWLGCLVTEVKPWLMAAPPGQDGEASTGDSARPIDTSAGPGAALADGAVLRRHPMTRWAHSPGTDGHLLFVDGQCRELPVALAGLAARLCAHRSHSGTELAPWLAAPGSAELLGRLMADGKLYF